MEMENRKKKIDDALASFVLVQKKDDKWCWAFSLTPSSQGFNRTQGKHETPEAALKAGIAYIRLTKPQLVRDALNIVIKREN